MNFISVSAFLVFFILGDWAFTETPLQTQKRLFRSLYYDDKVDGRYDLLGGCKGNAITFILDDLFEQRVQFKHGYLVTFKAVDTIHNFQSAFSHGVNFDGDRTRWSNGTPFYLSNFYFHTYIVLDDHVFDFSIRDGKVQRLPTYLRKSFLPPKGHSAKSSGFQPFFDDKSLIKTLSEPTLEMQVHRLDSVSLTKHSKKSNIDSRYHLGIPAFRGRPIDIFVSNGVVQESELPKRQKKAIIKRAHSLSLLIESGHFSRKRYFSTEPLCNQIFQKLKLN